MDKMKYLRVLLLITATMPLWDLGHPLWEVDDARYAEVPREMVETGDWLTPHLNYIDYIEKPPLIYWMTAVSYKTLGISESASRVPLVILALLGLLGTAWLGSWLFSKEAGLWAAVILGSCAEFSLLTHLHTPDLAVTVFLLWATAFILRALFRPKDSFWAGPAAGLAMGLAFLSKWLIALVFPGIWTCLLLALIPECRKNIRASAVLGALGVLVVIVGPYLWAMSSTHPRFLHHVFIEQHFVRYLTPHYDRPGPWYYFIGIDIAGLLPWSPLLLTASVWAAAKWKRSEPAEKALVAWIGLVFLFFSASHSKLPTYLLPIFPHQCLLGAGLLQKLSDTKKSLPWLDRAHWALAGLACAAIPIGLYLLPHFQTGAFPISRNITILGASLLIALALGWVYPKLLPWSAFFVTEIFLVGAHAAEPWLSVRSIAKEVRLHCETDSPLVTYDMYLQGLPFYTGRQVDLMVNWVGELNYGKADTRFRDRFGDDNAIRDIGKSGRKACVVLPLKEREYFSTLLPKGDLHYLETRGPWALSIIGSKNP